ncbi:MAG TPA: hypothetical protein VK464_20160 [Symbiobacteriaceae bacterium]|nr:hypothetical protein [Symbiobacteriaceae bacterium]
MSDKPQRPQPWYYQPQYRRHLYLPARAMRNAGLMAGYYSGLAWLVAAMVFMLLYLVAPATLASLYARYPAAPWGAGIGLALGLLGAILYRVLAPKNRKAPRVILPLLTGIGGIIGLGYALGGEPLGQLAILLCALGVGSFFYIEGYPND